jgi:hypothetical protein
MLSSKLAGRAIKLVDKELLLRGSFLEDFFLPIICLAWLLAAKAGHVSLSTSAASKVLSCPQTTNEILSSAHLAGEWAEDRDIPVVVYNLVDMGSIPLLLLITEYEPVLIALDIDYIIIGDCPMLNFGECYGSHVFSCWALAPSSMIWACTLLDDAPLSEGTLGLIIITPLETHTWHTKHRGDAVL